MNIVKNASGSRCSLAYCTSLWSQNNDTMRISFFKFPKDHTRCASWVQNCEAKYLPTTDYATLHQKYKLCSLHFEDKMFVNRLLKNRLSLTATPTVFVKKPIDVLVCSLVDSTSVVLSCSTPVIKYISILSKENYSLHTHQREETIVIKYILVVDGLLIHLLY
ncbi:52 kDa repressor of the inhibitor of the protein kinase-like [Adelges cooleyi]|uniref:52 kDa repressor of the inhibitor of the protein kinase-like n=1 Tax=Adelges cooleyi TaxID=133065 RepID=UPI002180641E|nr:52 kDa repressor of the inhibitor of the protein kinase-like [Adelges cooleyi]